MAYCPRLFFINKTMPQKGFISNLPIIQGNLEHDLWRLLSEVFNTTWRNWSLTNSPTLKELSQENVSATLTHVFKLALQNYPSYALELQKYMGDLTYRVNLWLTIQENKMTQMLYNGFSVDAIVSSILPWKTEEKVFSNEYGLYGRVDAIYNDGRCLIPEDIKTHQSKFKTLLQNESHKTQLLCYTIMLEENFEMPSPEARIFYTQDMTYDTFKATADEKAQLKIKIATARELIERAEIPPMLDGDDTIKCRHCYGRTQCFELAKEEGNGEWIEKLTNGSEGKFDLFGGVNLGN
jgi:CRISPR/Cas system-associated exonuclease Cas4 (RecB family)